MNEEQQDIHRLKVLSLMTLARYRLAYIALKQHELAYPQDYSIIFDVGEVLFVTGCPQAALKQFKLFLQKLHIYFDEDSSSLPSKPFHTSRLELYIEERHIFINTTAERFLANVDDIYAALARVSMILLDLYSHSHVVIEIIEALFTLHRMVFNAEDNASQGPPFPLDLVVLLARAKMIQILDSEGNSTIVSMYVWMFNCKSSLSI